MTRAWLPGAGVAVQPRGAELPAAARRDGRARGVRVRRGPAHAGAGGAPRRAGRRGCGCRRCGARGGRRRGARACAGRRRRRASAVSGAPTAVPCCVCTHSCRAAAPMFSSTLIHAKQGFKDVIMCAAKMLPRGVDTLVSARRPRDCARPCQVHARKCSGLAAACSAPCSRAGRAAWLSQRLVVPYPALTRRPAVRSQRARLRAAAAPAPAPAAAAAAAAGVNADLQSGWSASYGDGDGVVNLVSMQTCDRRGPEHRVRV